MSEWSYVTAAYVVTWAVIIGYTIRLEFAIMRRAREKFRVATREIKR